MTEEAINQETENSQHHSPAHSQEFHEAESKAQNMGSADIPPSEAECDRDNELESCARELADYKDRYLRTVAEMDNMRKRLEREKQDFLKFSSESILKDMIPVLDSLDKAIPNVTDAESPIAGYRDGVVMVQKQFLQTLAKHGLEPVEAVNQPFDPNFHQAIQRIESKDVTDETVLAEFAKGYSLHGRLIRPSMVSVKVPG